MCKESTESYWFYPIVGEHTLNQADPKRPQEDPFKAAISAVLFWHFFDFPEITETDVIPMMPSKRRDNVDDMTAGIYPDAKLQSVILPERGITVLIDQEKHTASLQHVFNAPRKNAGDLKWCDGTPITRIFYRAKLSLDRNQRCHLFETVGIELPEKPNPAMTMSLAEQRTLTRLVRYIFQERGMLNMTGETLKKMDPDDAGDTLDKQRAVKQMYIVQYENDLEKREESDKQTYNSPITVFDKAESKVIKTIAGNYFAKIYKLCLAADERAHSRDFIKGFECDEFGRKKLQTLATRYEKKLKQKQKEIDAATAKQQATERKVVELQTKLAAAEHDLLNKKKERIVVKEESREDVPDLSAEVESLQKQNQRLEAQIAEQNELITFLRSKVKRPTIFRKVSAWANDNFAGKLLILPKAEKLLAQECDGNGISIDVLCDAIQFLACEYRDMVMGRIKQDEMLQRCSTKYQRVFSCSDNGAMTLNTKQFGGQYWAEYAGKKIPLNCHLKYGNNPENLIRIYFTFDSSSKRIVVGSLPRHLSALTLQ